MNATNRTMVFVGVAAVTALAAAGVRFANRPPAVEGFSDVGQEFYTDFTDPLKATELSVVKFDSELKEPQSFSVKKTEKGLWVIPSHHDYPAEAEERLAKTAASLIGIRKVALQSRSKDDWARYGVDEPAKEGSTGEKDDSRGTRITLRDASGNSLVDLIVGKAVEGREKHFYVRQPEKNPVFIAKLDADLSAKFSDWIEPDLLKLNQSDIVKVVVDRYSVDEAQGAILQGEKLEFDKDKTSSKWNLAGLNAETEALKETPVTDVTRNLDQLKIVGVRPKPQGLNADLTVSPEVAENPLLRQILQQDMQRQGFFIARGENNKVKLVSNEGELIAGTNNGVRYTLYFGEVARGTAKDIETGLNEPKAAASGDEKKADAKTDGENKSDEASKDAEKKDAAPETPSEPENGPRRYLLVKVEYDESLLGPKPTEPTAPEKPAILNEVPTDGEKKPETSADPAPNQPAPAEPKAEEPKAEEPKAEEPKAEEPKAEEPKAEEPKAEEPKAEEPKAEEPKAEEPKKADEAECGQEPTTPASDEGKSAPSAPESNPQQPATPPEGDESSPKAENSADTPAEAPKSEAAAPSQESAPAATPATSPDPAAAQTPAQPPVDPKAEAQKQYDKALSDYQSAKATYESSLRTWEDRAKSGKKRVDELSARFGSWYYVITAESFEKFKLSREAVVGPKEEPKPADASATPK